LSTEQHARIAACARELDQPSEQRRANAAAAPIRDHGHAADVAVGKQPATADRITARVLGNGVHALRIERVPFQFFRNVLFDDEDGESDGAQLVRIVGPIDDAHGE
jgi:hypothetical protein